MTNTTLDRSSAGGPAPSTVAMTALSSSEMRCLAGGGTHGSL